MFNLNDYEDVDARIHKFYEAHPDGALITELVTNDEEKGIVVFKTTAYRVYLDTQPSAVGYARGSRKDRGVDRDFWLENCETSSIGRCIANLGLAAKGKRPSSLEMAKANDAKEHVVPTVRVRTKEHKEFLEARNEAAQIVWDTTIEPPSDVNPLLRTQLIWWLRIWLPSLFRAVLMVIASFVKRSVKMALIVVGCVLYP